LNASRRIHARCFKIYGTVVTKEYHIINTLVAADMELILQFSELVYRGKARIAFISLGIAVS
jgi:hypothetical protein